MHTSTSIHLSLSIYIYIHILASCVQTFVRRRLMASVDVPSCQARGQECGGGQEDGEGRPMATVCTYLFVCS